MKYMTLWYLSLRRGNPWLFSALLAALFAGCLTAARGADIGLPQRSINAGIIADYGAGCPTLGSCGGIAYPYVFYVLNTRKDGEPVGWWYENPFAPRQVTQTIAVRWNLASSLLGQNITQNMGPYWEVPLGLTSSTELSNYQILLLEVSSTDAGVGAVDVEKLRRFVDGGGILWIDFNGTNSGGSADTSGAPNSALPEFYPWLDIGAVAGGASPRGVSTLGLSSGPGVAAIASPYDLTQDAAFDSLPGLSNVFDSTIENGTNVSNNGPSIFDEESPTSGTNGLPTTPSQDVIATLHYGEGSVIITSTGTAGEMCLNNTNWEFNPLAAQPPTSLVQFGSDIVSQSNAPPGALSNRQPASALGDSFGSAMFPLWRYFGSVSGQFPPAAAYGRFAYVPDSNGDINQLLLRPTGNQASNQIGGTPPSIGAPVSAPEIQPMADGEANVYVETNQGQVYQVPNAPGNGGPVPLNRPSTFTFPAALGGALAPPAPDIFDHYLFASQPGGNYTTGGMLPAGLFIDDLAGNPGNPNYYPLIYHANPVTSILEESATGSPVAGIIHNQNDDIVAAYPTDRGLYTILVGARQEKLTASGYTQGNAGVNKSYATVLSRNSVYNGHINEYEPWSVYTIGTNGQRSILADNFMCPPPGAPSPPPTPNGTCGPLPDFQHFYLQAGTDPGAQPVYADYDIDFSASQYQVPTPSTVEYGGADRLWVGFGNVGLSQDTTNPIAHYGPPETSSPVMDRNGNIYYTQTMWTGNTGVAPSGQSSVDSSLICIHDGGTSATDAIAWRFRMPTTMDGAFNDAYGNSYGAFIGAYFVGPPVLDGAGNVYAAVYIPSSGSSAIFSFNPSKPVYAVFSVPGTGPLPGSVQTPTPQPGYILPVVVSQPVPVSGQFDEYGNVTSLSTSQYVEAEQNNQQSVGQSFSVTFNDFSTHTPENSTQPTELFPDLAEPEPLFLIILHGTQSNSSYPWYTNVNWSATFNGGPITGLAALGDYIYFTMPTATGATHLFRLATQGTPSTPGGPLITTGLNQQNKPIFEDLGDPGVGPVATPPAPCSTVTPSVVQNGALTVSNGSLLVSGSQGVADFSDEMTLITDASRLIGVDPDGDALFTVSSTSQVTASGSTNTPLSRPTSVTQLSADRYLMADSGNNRCVEIDRRGGILWELDKFVDNNSLLQPGDPLTLSNPTSVQVWRDYLGNVHYLIADSGNERIVDVVDVYAGGAPFIPEHVLDWISNTRGRGYQYASAVPYIANTNGGNPSWAVAALVTNKRIAPLNADGSMRPPSADTDGDSIVLLNYNFNLPATPTVAGVTTANPRNGATADPDSGNVIQVLTNPFTFRANPGAQPLPFLNPHFLGSYTPDPLQMAGLGWDGHDELLYADDNGAYDIDPNWDEIWNGDTAYPGTIPNVLGTASATINWNLGATGYQLLTTPIDAVNTTFLRSTIPFTPTSIQRVGTDDNGGTVTGRYLIANPFTQGNVETVHGPPPGFGGEVFLYSAASGAMATSRTFSRPSNTSALSQPSSAVLAK